MWDLPLNALRAFAAVCQTGGIRPAAKELKVTHSAVSRHVRELEAWLGLPLIEKRPGERSISLTVQGTALGRAAVAGLSELADGVAKIREARRANAVTVSTTPSVAARWLRPRMADLAEQASWVELSVLADQAVADPAAQGADPAAQGADLCLRMGRGPWPDLECTPLMDDALYPVMGPDFWHRHGSPRDLAVLATLPLIHDRDPQAGWQAWRDVYGPADLDVRPGPRFASSDLVLRAAVQGLGVALARGRLAAGDVASGALMRPFGELSVPLPDAYWIVRPLGSSRAAVDTVADWLRDQAAAAGL